MTPEAQRIAIAEACGLSEIWEAGHGVPGTLSASYITSTCLMGEIRIPLPDYHNDRNAMHDALMRLIQTPEAKGFFGLWQQWVVEGYERGCEPDASDWEAIFEMKSPEIFTAVTIPLWALAECLLRTIGKWEESK